MNFELIGVKAAGMPQNVPNTTKMSMLVNIQVGVVGMPNEDKYTLFKPEFSQFYEWEKALSSQEAEDGMTIFAAEWVATNYPNI